MAVLLVLSLVQGCGERMTPEEAALPIEGVEPVETRGADWPVLPREGGEDGYDDPVREVNTVFFYFNGALDFLFLEPIAQFYRGMMPTDARHAVSRAFTNLAEPIVLANHLLQLEGERAGKSLGRFLVNSTIGVTGLFDVATSIGLEADDADFGQTLHHYGISSGPYIVLPILGPTTVRDAVGFGIDGLLDPRTFVLAPTQLLPFSLERGGRAPRGDHRTGSVPEGARRRSLRRGSRLELSGAPARAHRRLQGAQVRGLPRLFARVGRPHRPIGPPRAGRRRPDSRTKRAGRRNRR